MFDERYVLFIPVIIAVTSFSNSSSHLLKSSRRFLTTGSLHFTELGMLGYSESRVLMVMGGQSSFARWVEQGGTTRITTCRADSERRLVVESPVDQLLFPFEVILRPIAAEEGVGVMTHGLYLQPCAGRLNEG